MCQRVAMRANREEDENGRFFQDRYKAVRLLDEASLLACAAYVDLNPIRAAVADTLEGSDHTSLQRRLEGRTESEAQRGFRSQQRQRLRQREEMTWPLEREIESFRYVFEVTSFLPPCRSMSRLGRPDPAPAFPRTAAATKDFLPSRWSTICSCSTGRRVRLQRVKAASHPFRHLRCSAGSVWKRRRGASWCATLAGCSRTSPVIPGLLTRPAVIAPTAAFIYGVASANCCQHCHRLRMSSPGLFSFRSGAKQVV